MRYRSGMAVMGWLLLAAMALQLGRFASFEMRRLAVRHEVKWKLKDGVPENERAYFTFTKAEYDALNWLKPEKEFTVGAGFFDVIHKRVDDAGIIHLACMNDRQESALFADLAQLVESAMDQKGDGAQRMRTLLGDWKYWIAERPVWRCDPPHLPVLKGGERVALPFPGYAPEWWTPPRGLASLAASP